MPPKKVLRNTQEKANDHQQLFQQQWKEQEGRKWKEQDYVVKFPKCQEEDKCQNTVDKVGE